MKSVICIDHLTHDNLEPKLTRMPLDNLGSSSRSILRYPGSKARLTQFIAQSLVDNGYERSIFIEPFCGGASVGIALLEANLVSEIVLNDKDPLIASLWKCIFLQKQDAQWLADKVRKVPLTLAYWDYQKRLTPRTLREAALKCLYLNRTSFSGMLHSSAGPIGGRHQTKWTVGCRFNRELISKRITELSNLSSGVRTVTQQSWEAVCTKWTNKQNGVFYLDPPFYHKADRLYRFIFQDADHKNLHSFLTKTRTPWLLSYDNAVKIRELYEGNAFQARIIDNTYSAHPIGGNSFIGKELVYSNLKRLPRPAGDPSSHRGLSIRAYGKYSSKDALRIPMTTQKVQGPG